MSTPLEIADATKQRLDALSMVLGLSSAATAEFLLDRGIAEAMGKFDGEEKAEEDEDADFLED